MQIIDKSKNTRIINLCIALHKNIIQWIQNANGSTVKCENLKGRFHVIQLPNARCNKLTYLFMHGGIIPQSMVHGTDSGCNKQPDWSVIDHVDGD
jgi:hypothetical protein